LGFIKKTEKHTHKLVRDLPKWVEVEDDDANPTDTKSHRVILIPTHRHSTVRHLIDSSITIVLAKT